ncbi:MAG: adenylosuccinate lyase [Candidatus Micrarchaeia archaeon]
MVVSPLDNRYATEMNAVFDEERKLARWLEIEVALAKAHAKLGHIPRKAAAEIARAARKVRLERVRQIEAEIHHDLMAMVKALEEACSGGAGAYVHLGATSYDIEDTATALTFRDAFGLIKKRLKELHGVIVRLAKNKKDLVCVGRTHGQHAVPTTYGLKFAVWARELERHLERVGEAEKRLYVGKMSGAVGSMATFGEDAFKLQQEVMKELGLRAAQATNQVLQRDRHAEAIFLLALIAATLEKIAKEIRNLQRSEIMEVAEPFGRRQVGSSTMPQKRNPHRSERICSLARVVRANVLTALENIALEHERDLTNSASERLIFPESFILTDYMLKESIAILEGLEFFPENIKRNLESSKGLILAERVMIALAEKGMPRGRAHALLREASIRARNEGRHLKEVLAENAEVMRLLTARELEELFDYSTYIGKAREIVNAL